MRECHLNHSHNRELQKISTVLLSIGILKRASKIKKNEEGGPKLYNISRERRCARKMLCSRYLTRAAGRLHVTRTPAEERHNFQKTPAEAKLGSSRSSVNFSIEKFRASVVGP